MKRSLLSACIAGGVLSTLALATLPVSLSGVNAPGQSAPAVKAKAGGTVNLTTLSDSPVIDIDPDTIPVPVTRVRIVPDTTSGIYGANYTYTDPNGNVFGYYINWHLDYDYWYYANEDEPTPVGEYRINSKYLCGVKSNANSVKFPTQVTIDSIIPEIREFSNYGFLPVGVESMDTVATFSEAIFHHDITNEGTLTSFPVPDGVEKHELTDVYLPQEIGYAFWGGKFQTDVRNFHFCSDNVPSLRLDNDANGKITLYVPDSLYFPYKDYVKENYSQYTLVVRSEAPLTPVYVNVSEPGTLATEIVKLVENLETVRWVVVTGTPNEEDLRMFRRMPHLEILDLSQVTGLKTVSGLNMLDYLREVALPDEIETIGVSAFEGCSSLETINMPANLKLIRESAFCKCSSLRSVELPEGVKEIEGHAFRESAISNINLKNVKWFGGYCFQYSKLLSADLTSAITIGEEAFAYIPLASVFFSNNLKNIGWAAFRCTHLREITIPSSVVYLSGYAFDYNYSNTPLKKITVENSPYIFQWYETAFGGTRPDTIIWKPLFPESENKFGDNECLKNATMFVPKLTYSNYLLSDAWAGCKDIRPMEDDLDYVYLDREFTLLSEEGLTPDAVIDNHGYFTVRRKTDLPLGKFSLSGSIYHNGGYYWDDNYQESMGYQGATFIPKSTVSADQTEVNISLAAGSWSFLALPFDVKVSDIEVEDETLWVVRRYSGEDRANLTGNTWINVTENETLKAGQGYIFHCAKEGRGDVKFTFRADKENPGLYSTANMETSLENWPSEFAHNAHWNLVGNSFPAYVSLRAFDFNAPVTVWNGSTYNAYSPVDDEYVFSPFEAFFVQLQEIEGGDVLKLDERGRAHSYEAAREFEMPQEVPAEAKRKARRMESRMVLDLSLAGEKMTDRTRLVVNEAASTGYESNRDAAKFMSTEKGAAQIFMLNDGQRMAIDERPMGEGVYAIGTSFGEKGTYTISLAARNFEGYTAYLTDNKTNQTVELSAAPYEFEAAAGTDEGRFTLRIVRGIESGASEIAADAIKVTVENNVLSVSAPEETAIIVAAADGKVVAEAESAAYTVQLPAGVYVVKAGETVKKINIR